MNLSAHLRPHQDILLALFYACQEPMDGDAFAERIYPLLRKLIPHQHFVCGIVNILPLRVVHAVNIGFPDILLKECADPNGRGGSPVLRRWLKTNAPVYFEPGLHDHFLEAEDLPWLRRFSVHSLSNLVAHGVQDLQGGAASYFCFAGIERWNDASRDLLQLTIPHLHRVLSQHYLLTYEMKRHHISGREKDVLRLICAGKTNPEIGIILSISPWTVKVHVKNVLLKLDAKTRSQAAAIALQGRLISD